MLGNGSKGVEVNGNQVESRVRIFVDERSFLEILAKERCLRLLKKDDVGYTSSFYLRRALASRILVPLWFQ